MSVFSACNKVHKVSEAFLAMATLQGQKFN
jgi:hypothetical protein